MRLEKRMRLENIKRIFGILGLLAGFRHFVRIVQILIMGIFGFILAACSGVDDEVFNQPAGFWYDKIAIAIKDGNLDKADSYFNSLQSEHISSPLINDALLLLAQAHMDKSEHLLSSFFINEYKVRFSSKNNVDYIAFLANKANFYAFNNYSKDQGFINDNISEIGTSVIVNGSNLYLPYMQHILTSFKLAKREINDEIVRIYKMKDKEAAWQKYEDSTKELGVRDIEFIPSHIPWYVKMFSW